MVGHDFNAIALPASVALLREGRYFMTVKLNWLNFLY